jgi:hypothetical protein
MPTLGIIACTVLHNELAYLIARDTGVNNVVLVDNKEGWKLTDRLRRSRACEAVEMVEVHHLGARSYDDDEIVVWMNPSEMHNSQERMRNAMTAEIKLLSESVDCILLLYGQCRCQTLDIGMLEGEIGIPILYLVDHANVVVDDCISAIMGSSQRYLETMKRHKGAFFITPGYVDGYALSAEGRDLVELMEEVERMTIALEAMDHPPLIKLENMNEGGPAYQDLIDRFARTFDLEVLTIPCDMSVFESSYDWARSVMRARTRHREPVMLMAGGVLAAAPLTEHMWDELDR